MYFSLVLTTGFATGDSPSPVRIVSDAFESKEFRFGVGGSTVNIATIQGDTLLSRYREAY